jgi:hypothetical protein
MKALLPVLALLIAGPLLGQIDNPDGGAPTDSKEVLQNADFSDGTTHWHGDCKTAAADLSTDFTSNQASDAKGIVVELHSSTWTKVTQDIDSKVPNMSRLVLTVTYQLSSDFALSDRKEDYVQIANGLGLDTASFAPAPGKIMAIIDVPTNQRLTSSSTQDGSQITTRYVVHNDQVSVATFSPQGQQTVTLQLAMPMRNPDNRPVFVLGFPPGQGKITLLNVSLQPSGRRGPFGRPPFPQPMPPTPPQP